MISSTPTSILTLQPCPRSKAASASTKRRAAPIGRLSPSCTASAAATRLGSDPPPLPKARRPPPPAALRPLSPTVLKASPATPPVSVSAQRLSRPRLARRIRNMNAPHLLEVLASRLDRRHLQRCALAQSEALPPTASAGVAPAMPVLAGPAQRLLPLQLHLNRSVWKVPHLPRWMTASSMMIQISIRAPQTLRAATMTNITPLKPMGNRKMGARALLHGCTHLLHTSGRHAVKDRLVQR